MADTPKKYIVTDGELVLELEREGKWYCVTSPFNPDITTQARTLEEAFEMARDVIQLFADDRAGKPAEPSEPPKPKKRVKVGVKKTA